jgi:hypothetical protein
MNIGKIKDEIKAKEEELTLTIEKELKDRDLRYKLKLTEIDLWNGFITFHAAGGIHNKKRITIDMNDDLIEVSSIYNSYTYMKAVIEITEKLIVKEFER